MSDRPGAGSHAGAQPQQGDTQACEAGYVFYKGGKFLPEQAREELGAERAPKGGICVSTGEKGSATSEPHYEGYEGQGQKEKQRKEKGRQQTMREGQQEESEEGEACEEGYVLYKGGKFLPEQARQELGTKQAPKGGICVATESESTKHVTAPPKSS
eukprot:TRINITY_DN5250_c0_g1_i2.p2 TRINITY_DN5250_c0_g1~~TRINITY_DN5250_c0_g1_i2.p2  ORF type:complete len:157 (-),score=14.32 TRINITY_DN5250_c0_g1_i2:72-542(-)